MTFYSKSVITAVLGLVLAGCGGGVSDGSGGSSSGNNQNAGPVVAPVFSSSGTTGTGSVSGPQSTTGGATTTVKKGALSVVMEAEGINTAYKELFLGIDKVQVRRASTTGEPVWENVVMPKPFREDLAQNRRDVPFDFAAASIPVGNYDKVRIFFASNSLEFINYIAFDAPTDIDGVVVRAFNLVDEFAQYIEMPAIFSVKDSANTSLGITLNVRSLFTPVRGQALLRPTGYAVDRDEAGSIEVKLGEIDSPVKVSVQRGRKIIRSKTADAAGVVKFTQLPLSKTDNDTYQIVFSSPNYVTKIINNVPVSGGGKSTMFMALKDSITLEKVILTTSSSIINDQTNSSIEVLQRLDNIPGGAAVVTQYLLVTAPGSIGLYLPAQMIKMIDYKSNTSNETNVDGLQNYIVVRYNADWSNPIEKEGNAGMNFSPY